MTRLLVVLIWLGVIAGKSKKYCYLSSYLALARQRGHKTNTDHTSKPRLLQLLNSQTLTHFLPSFNHSNLCRSCHTLLQTALLSSWQRSSPGSWTMEDLKFIWHHSWRQMPRSRGRVSILQIWPSYTARLNYFSGYAYASWFLSPYHPLMNLNNTG